MKILFLFIITIFVLRISSCGNNQTDSSIKDSQDTIDFNRTKGTELKKSSWHNPIMTPYGTDLARVIKGYYLVGDFDKIRQFVISPPCYTKNQLDLLFRKSKWGYDIRVNNVQWKSEEVFVLNCKMVKNNTVGMEQYLGKIINDTAKLYLFPEKENLFQYFGDEDLDNPCRFKNWLDHIYFLFDDITILRESHDALWAIARFLESNPSVEAHFVGHTSSEGSKAHNKTLSEGRARAICDFLITQGIAKERLSYEGMGDTRPLENYYTPENNKVNRRVEMRLRRL